MALTFFSKLSQNTWRSVTLARRFLLIAAAITLTLAALSSVDLLPMPKVAEMRTLFRPITEPRGDVLRACSLGHRLKRLNDACSHHHRFDLNRKTEKKTRTLTVVALNHEKKIMYCGLPKSGSRSWLLYMVNMTQENSGPDKWNIRDQDFMNSVGIDYRKNVPLTEVLDEYKDYTKFTVVRHPMQWVVALYFEAIHQTNKYKHEDGSKPTLHEFINNLSTYPLFHMAWSSYELYCHHCQIDYDFIIKAETVEEDGAMLSKEIATSVLPPVRHVNTREQSQDAFKYDYLLQEAGHNQSAILHKLLTHYDKELKMFGYQWDSVAERSLCINSDEQGKCC